jgi:major vault protein
LLLRATENLKNQKVYERDDNGKLIEKTKDLEPGDRWMLYGPGRYIPTVEVEVIERRVKICLDKNEGIYVRDNKSGSLRAVIGESYMLKAHEDLFEMEIGDSVEKLIK